MVYYGRLFVFTLSFEFLGKVSLNLNEFEVNCADSKICQKCRNSESFLLELEVFFPSCDSEFLSCCVIEFFRGLPINFGPLLFFL